MTAGCILQVYFVNEEDLYDVILDSRKPKSISFSKMDEIEFEKLYSNVLDIILANFSKELDREQFLKILNCFA